MRYKGKIDLWIKLLLWLMVVMYLPLMFIAENSEEILIFTLLTIFMAIIILPMIYVNYVELREDYIYMKISVLRAKIPYDNIKSIRICENWRSSFGLSRERIEIKEHGKGFVRGTTYISPMDREEFFDELKRRCKNLEDIPE